MGVVLRVRDGVIDGKGQRSEGDGGWRRNCRLFIEGTDTLLIFVLRVKARKYVCLRVKGSRRC